MGDSNIPLKNFVEGILEVIPLEEFLQFTPEEITKILNGISKFDFIEFKNAAKYSGNIDENHQLVKWFWEIVLEMSEEARWELFWFVTNLRRLPVIGISGLQPPFTLSLAEEATATQLPTAGTCGNKLEIGSYPSKAVFKEKLLISIKEGKGFGLK